MIIASSVNSSFGLGDGLIVSLFSMTVVFIVLLILQFTIEIFSRVVNGSNGAKVAEPAAAVQPVSVVAEDDSEEQLVAKIVAGSLVQDGSGQNVVIKSIKKVQ